ncbi:unnamed protein product [Closterium sp. Yama58-4]|nr:unnamed protein product [Closterium sp. Yama58-4]
MVESDSAGHFEALPLISMSALSPKRWRVGERVEVSRQGAGLQGGWFTAVLLAVDRGAQTGSVRYEEMMEADGVTRLSEHVSLDQIRPVPPGMEGGGSATWNEGQAVEVWHNNAWWIGTILGRTTPEPDSPGATSGARLGTEAEGQGGVEMQAAAHGEKDQEEQLNRTHGQVTVGQGAVIEGRAGSVGVSAGDGADCDGCEGAVGRGDGEKRDAGAKTGVDEKGGDEKREEGGDYKGEKGGDEKGEEGGDEKGGEGGDEKGGEGGDEKGGEGGDEKGEEEKCQGSEEEGKKATALATILGSKAGIFALSFGSLEGEGVRQGVEEKGLGQSGGLKPDEGGGRACSSADTTCQDGTCQDGTCQDGTCQDGTCQDGTCQDGTCQDGTCQDGTCQDGTCQDGTCQDGTCQDGTCQDGTCQDGTCQDGTCQDGTCQDGTGQDGTCQDGTGQSIPCEDDPWDLGAADAAVSATTAPAVVVYKRRKTGQGYAAGRKGGLHTHKGIVEVEEKETEVERGGGRRPGDGKSTVDGKVRKREGLARQCKEKKGGEERRLGRDRGGGGREGVLKATTPNVTLKSPALLKSPDLLRSSALLKSPDLLKAPAACLANPTVPPTTPVASRALGAPAANTPAVGVGAPATPAAMPATPVVVGENLRGQRGQRGQLPGQLAEAASEALQDRRGEGGTVDGGRSSEDVEEVEEEEEEVQEVGEEGVGEERAGGGVVVVLGSEDEGEEAAGAQETGCRGRGGVVGKRARTGEEMGSEEVEGRKLFKKKDKEYADDDATDGGGDDTTDVDVDGDDDADEDGDADDDGDGDDDVVEVVGEEVCGSIVRHESAAGAATGHHARVTSPSALTTAAGRLSGHGHGSAEFLNKAHAIASTVLATPHAPVTPASAGNHIISSARVTSTPPGHLLCSEQHIGGVKRQRFFGSWHRQGPLFQDTHTHTGVADLAVNQGPHFQDTHAHTGIEGLAGPRIVHHASSGAAEVNEQYRPSTGSLYREDAVGLAHGEGRGGRGVEAVAETAYGGVLDALWVQGGGQGITWDKEVLLTDLRRALSISNDQHSRLLGALLSWSEVRDASCLVRYCPGCGGHSSLGRILVDILELPWSLHAHDDRMSI